MCLTVFHVLVYLHNHLSYLPFSPLYDKYPSDWILYCSREKNSLLRASPTGAQKELHALQNRFFGRRTAPAEAVVLKKFGRTLKNAIARSIFWAPNCARFTICTVSFLGAHFSASVKAMLVPAH